MGVAAGTLAWTRQKMSRLGVVLPDDMVAKLEHLPLADCKYISNSYRWMGVFGFLSFFFNFCFFFGFFCGIFTIVIF